MSGETIVDQCAPRNQDVGSNIFFQRSVVRNSGSPAAQHTCRFHAGRCQTNQSRQRKHSPKQAPINAGNVAEPHVVR